MNILIYSPNNLRAVDQQSQAELLISLGHKVFLVTWREEGALHDNFKKLGAEVYSSSDHGGRYLVFFLRQINYLVKFCKEHKIDVCFAHLQSNAMIAGFAKYFVKTRFFYMRHNADYYQLMPSKKDKFVNVLANRFSDNVLAISEDVKRHLLKEGVDEKKITRLNLCYNFDQYIAERKFNHDEIRASLDTGFLILCIARLDFLKRHILCFEVIEQLVESGYDCKLICVGDGPIRAELEGWVKEHKMENNIIIRGQVDNVFDYLMASDILMLLSYSEASSNSVKEAAMCKKPVIVCKDVGDSGEYIVNNFNSFMVDKEYPVPETVALLKQIIPDKQRLASMGEKLYEVIDVSFGIENVKKKYKTLLSEI